MKAARAFYVVRNRDRPVQLSAQCRRCHNGGPAHPDYVPIITGRPPKPSRPSLIDSICVICGDAFVARRNAIARGQGTTCSLSCANSLRKIPERDRFAALVGPPDEHGCRFWAAAIDARGYGRFTGDGGKSVDAHRFAYEAAYGPLPTGIQALHRCDVYWAPGDITYRRCVEPAHLFAGTHQDNMADRDAKGRQAQGVRFPHAKLTDENVREMRNLRVSEGWSQQALAKRFGVSQVIVSGVLRGALWKHVDGPIEANRALGPDTGRAWKLTPDNVREIRRLAASGETQASIARFAGVSQVMISRILRGVSWAEIR